MAREKLRVLVVDDSSICRESLRWQLERDGDIEIVAEGEDAFSAVALVEKHRPDLVTMDVQMPGKSGLEAVEQIMSRVPTPVLVVTAESLSDEAGVAFRAIENGALDITPKPSMTDDAAAASLRALVRQLATVPVFRREDERARATTPAPSGRTIELAILGAGHGAMGSVMAFFARIPRRLKCRVVLHQPIADEVAHGYARYLTQASHQEVVVARPPEQAARPGQILLVPGIRATFMTLASLRIERGAASAETVLRSAAEAFGPRAAGILLGPDEPGALAGLRALRDAGGATFLELARGATLRPDDVVASAAAERACSVEEIADWLVASAAF